MTCYLIQPDFKFFPGRHGDSVVIDREHVKRPETHLHQSECGSILLIVAFVLVSLLGFAGLAVDFGYYFVQKARLQALVDAGALACGYKGCEPTSASLALNSDVFSPINFEAVPMGVEVISAAADPNDQCLVNECYRVFATKSWDTYFLGLFNIPELSVTVTAKATAGVEYTASTAPALLALGLSGTGLRFSGSAPSIIFGDIFSNGSIRRFGTGSVIVNGDVGSAGAVTNLLESSVTGDITMGREPLDDPCRNLPRPVDTASQCLQPPNNLCSANGATVSIPSGTYCSLNISVDRNNCTVELEGTYFIRNGGMTINVNNSGGRVRSRNAFFYIESGNVNISMARNAEIDLQPSGSGPYAHLLIWHAGSSLSSDFNLNHANASIEFGGMIYAPNSTVRIQKGGQSVEDTVLTGLIASSVELVNNGNNNNASPIIVNAPAQGVCGGSSNSTTGANDGATGKTRLIR